MPQHSGKGESRLSPRQQSGIHGEGSTDPCSELDDTVLVARAQAGEHDAFGVLVQRHGRVVLNVIDKMIRDRTVVEDLWQETFVRAWENLQSYEQRPSGETGSGPGFVSWLYRIATNLTLDELRRRSRWRIFSWDFFKPRHANDPDDSETYDPPADIPDTVSLLETQEDIRRVRRALDTLSPEWRMMLVMREYQDLPYEEIAEILEVPIGTVRSRLARAREQLRLALLRNASQGMVS
ncbi:MAG: sigma-70 family RNA polymerase sigma factor [Candidatus Binatia bacterium]